MKKFLKDLLVNSFYAMIGVLISIIGLAIIGWISDKKESKNKGT